MSQYNLPGPEGQPSYLAPQNSPYYDQVSAYQPPAYPQPPVAPYAPVYAAVFQPAPVARPKLTITPIITLIICAACIVLRLVELVSSIRMVNSYNNLIYKFFTDSHVQQNQNVISFINGISQVLQVLNILLLISVAIYFILGIFVYRGRNWARILMAIIAIFGIVGSTLHLLCMLTIQRYIDEGKKDLIQSQLPVPHFEFESMVPVLVVIYASLIIANFFLLVFLWLPGTNAFIRNSKIYRLVQNSMA
ncbi:MAG: hypothetical protein Q3991_00495 [Rothia sp. (in: high G+C Gram-positive bacteria)]|uniref:hypothetical protein n=1 Tax=Rothia sp. (in: high G+C Gram-positive bacteria) TaxID=1885016 RepID=UPI0026DCD879|nr:hypothetical protein [Rothia sp. (in: high G+C Gram-positive bacteria)]MDO4883406.1 hypothetical protein [Rothia sp. (in: high G+C Gram-positive bacteria)]